MNDFSHHPHLGHPVHSVLDVAEQAILARVREQVATTVRETLLAEFEALVQKKTNEALAEILFELSSERDILRMTDHIHVLVQWVKCKEEKRKFRTQTVVVNDDFPQDQI